MAEWTPIQPGEPEVIGPDPQAPGLLQIMIPLQPPPPSGWGEFFTNPTGVSMSLSMHPPRLSGSIVHLRPPDAEVRQYVDHVHERIAAANRRYETSVLPELRRREAEDQARSAQTARRIKEAQEQLKRRE